MNKENIFLVGLVITILCLSGCSKDKISQVCFGNQCVEIEIAQTPEELSQGLQYRESLASGHGMLFVFPQLVEAKFWMKNTLIPLDMIWLDEAGRVIYIKKNAPPCLSAQCPAYGPEEPVLYVLEVNAGYADAYGIQTDDRANVKIVDKKQK